MMLNLRENKKLFMAHAIAGYPSLSESEKICLSLIKNGADILELQIPFSDPMADGPTIANACTEALAKKAISVKDVLALAKKLTKHKKPVVIMSYLNPVFTYGLPKFATHARKAGVSGLIMPDTPYDTPEGQELIAACKSEGIAFIPVVSPGTPEDRLSALAKHSSGFVYCTTRQGITGTGGAFAKSLSEFVDIAHTIFDLPIALGFGISTRQDVLNAYKIADIAIAGSVFVKAAQSKKPSHSVATTINKLLK